MINTDTDYRQLKTFYYFHRILDYECQWSVSDSLCHNASISKQLLLLNITLLK